MFTECHFDPICMKAATTSVCVRLKRICLGFLQLTIKLLIYKCRAVTGEAGKVWFSEQKRISSSICTYWELERVRAALIK